MKYGYGKGLALRHGLRKRCAKPAVCVPKYGLGLVVGLWYRFEIRRFCITRSSKASKRKAKESKSTKERCIKFPVSRLCVVESGPQARICSQAH